MEKQSVTTIVATCVVAIMLAPGCSGQAGEASIANPPAEGRSTIILVENTSISLPVKYFKSDRDRFMEYIHSTFNNLLEGKVR